MRTEHETNTHTHTLTIWACGVSHKLPFANWAREEIALSCFRSFGLANGTLALTLTRLRKVQFACALRPGTVRAFYTFMHARELRKPDIFIRIGTLNITDTLAIVVAHNFDNLVNFVCTITGAKV